MTTQTPTTVYAVHSYHHDLMVHRVPRLTISDNRKTGDRNQTIDLVVSTDGDLWVVLTSNADDQAIGYIDEWGNLIRNPDVDCDTWFTSWGDGYEEEWLHNTVGEAIEDGLTT